jgi:hypothetical protein
MVLQLEAQEKTKPFINRPDPEIWKRIKRTDDDYISQNSKFF